MTGLLYITKPDMRPLQTYLYVIVTEAVNVDETLVHGRAGKHRAQHRAIRAATIVLACVPIMCVYPFCRNTSSRACA